MSQQFSSLDARVLAAIATLQIPSLELNQPITGASTQYLQQEVARATQREVASEQITESLAKLKEADLVTERSETFFLSEVTVKQQWLDRQSDLSFGECFRLLGVERRELTREDWYKID